MSTHLSGKGAQLLLQQSLQQSLLGLIWQRLQRSCINIWGLQTAIISSDPLSCAEHRDSLQTALPTVITWQASAHKNPYEARPRLAKIAQAAAQE